MSWLLGLGIGGLIGFFAAMFIEKLVEIPGQPPRWLLGLEVVALAILYAVGRQDDAMKLARRWWTDYTDHE